jgi:hypothetical protein
MLVKFWSEITIIGDICVGERIIMTLILNKQVMRFWAEFNWLKMGFDGCLL